MNLTLTDKEIENLWYVFSDIPVNENDDIILPFYIFPIGTDKIEIWHWFDEHYSKGVIKLLHPHKSS